MAAITIATRAVIIDKVKDLVNQLEAINDAAKQMQPALVGLSKADVTDTIDKLLAAGGLATGTTGALDTISDEIVAILYGTITVLVNGTATALSWTHTS